MLDLSKEFHPMPKPVKKVKMPKPMKKAGKKTKEWIDVRKELVDRFAKAGIVKCEIRHDNCQRDNYLGFAHLDKRTKLTKDDLYKVVLACQSCHYWVEFETSRGFMRSYLSQIIKERRVQP